MGTENKMEVILLLYRFMVHLHLEYNMLVSVASQQALGEYRFIKSSEQGFLRKERGQRRETKEIKHRSLHFEWYKA